MLTIKLLDKGSEELYTSFLEVTRASLFWHSLKYRNFLREILSSSEDNYFLAMKEDKIVGVLPSFLKRLSDGRGILNSLPFFGSHGSFLISDKIKEGLEKEAIKKALLDALMEKALQKKSITLTIVDNFQSVETSFYESYFNCKPADRRIGQLTDMSLAPNSEIEAGLMEKFHSKTRNMVRKGLKSGFQIACDESQQAMETLYALHSQNMSDVGGKEKPYSVFSAIQKLFKPESDYRIYVAKREGEVAAMMLVFYYKEYCEYFTPVIDKKFRSDQPLSALIFQAMQDCIKRGIRFWNWGGTWESQDGVYLFKKRWGAEDYPYEYYNVVLEDKYLRDNFDSVIEKAQFFYIAPFSGTYAGSIRNIN